jgi:ribose/xylose/arabinose/galactoside ABC-type transport system permease subunit
MPDHTERSISRLHAAAGITTGLALVTTPQRVLDALAPEFPRERRWLVRAFGARVLVQDAAVLLRPHPSVVAAGAAVDVLHAVSMLPFLRSTRYGRAARISGGVSAGAAVAGWALARSQRR